MIKKVPTTFLSVPCKLSPPSDLDPSFDPSIYINTQSTYANPQLTNKLKPETYMECESSSKKQGTVFEDLFPSMVARLGVEGFMDELCKGFRLLMDEEKGLITFESLKRNSSSVLGLDLKVKGAFGKEEVIDEDEDEMIREMVREGDLDGDGCLNLMEFCVLMFRLSPALMAASTHWIHDSLF